MILKHDNEGQGVRRMTKAIVTIVPTLTGDLTVFTRKPGLLRRRNRAVTLIEAVLYISIALALIVGGLVFFQQASTAAKTSALVRQLSAIVAETRILLQGQSLPAWSNYATFETTGLNVNPMLIAAGAVPTDMVTGAATLNNPFGGTTRITAGSAGQGTTWDVVLLSVRGIPPSVCSRLIAATGSSASDGNITTSVSHGQINYGVSQSNVPTTNLEAIAFPMNPTQAGDSCNYGSLAHRNAGYTTPSTPRLTGNVNVYIYFWLER
jgi:hypothetical protein